MTIRLAAPIALLLSVAAPALAGDVAQTAPAAEPAADAKPDKQQKICRNEVRTGSVMPRRVCRTAAQIEEEQRQAERFREQQNQMGASAR